MGSLYLVATPIGNRQDISLRALQVLREVAWVAAEDTRTSGRLLKHFDIEQRYISLHEHNEAERIGRILTILGQGEDVAIISDAGTPLLSDPGYALVQAVIAADYAVIPIPGPSALLAALTASGLPGDRFLFLGFPPRKQQARRSFLQNYSASAETLVFYESARRLLALLSDVQEILGQDRPVVIARELTKMYESFWRGTAAAAVQHFSEAPLGEVVLLVGGAKTPPEPDLGAALATVQGLQAGGMALSQAVRLVVEITGLPRRLLYEKALQQQKQDPA